MNHEISTSSITQTIDAAAPGANRVILSQVIARRVVIGAFLGSAWGAALRAWMTILALQFGDRPEFTWSGTFGAILLPAALMGGVIGGTTSAAETTGSKPGKWAILSPLLLVLGPIVFLPGFISSLFTTGLGGGAIAVALIGMLGGYALSGSGIAWRRWVCGLLAVLFSFAVCASLFIVNSSGAALQGAGEAFGGLFFVLLMALLIAGVGAPYRFRAKKTGFN